MTTALPKRSLLCGALVVLRNLFVSSDYNHLEQKEKESSKESSENMFSPRPPRTSPRSRRQPFRSPRLSPRASAPRAPRRRGPSVRPRQSVVVDMGSVATDLTVQPQAGAQAPQPEEAPECGNNQTKGYVYRSSASGGGWRGASSEVVFPRSQLQFYVGLVHWIIVSFEDTIGDTRLLPNEVMVGT